MSGARVTEVSTRGVSLNTRLEVLARARAASKRVYSALAKVTTEAGDELLEGTYLKRSPLMSGFNNKHGPREKLEMSGDWVQCHCGAQEEYIPTSSRRSWTEAETARPSKENNRVSHRNQLSNRRFTARVTRSTMRATAA